MDDLFYRAVIALFIGGIAAFQAYETYEMVGMASALVILFAVSWFLFRFASPQRIWNTIGFLKKPPIAAFIVFLAVFYYVTWEYGFGFWEAALYGVAFAIIGAAAGMFLYKYWNIGP